MERTKESPATPPARGMPPQFLADVGQPHASKHLALASFHGLGLFVGMHMIPSAQVQKAMDKLMKGRTCFVIAHRLSTIVDADLILVLNHGHIVEQGTHVQLLAKKGFYYDLYTSQYAV